MRQFLTRLLVAVLVLAAFFTLYGTPWNDWPEADLWPDQSNARSVSWYVVGTEAARAHVHAVLEDRRGWQQSGVDFRETSRATGFADIVIIMFDPAEENPCRTRGGLTACARGVGGALNSRGCVIYIPTGYTKTEVMTGFVNHEAGHCLGFGHTGTGTLMRPSFQTNLFNNVIDGPFWPTEPEIDALRRHLR